MDHARIGRREYIDKSTGTKYYKHIELGRQKIEQEAVLLATSQRNKHEDEYDHAIERGTYDVATGLVNSCELEKRVSATRRARLMERNILIRNFKVAFVMSYIYPVRRRVGDAYAAIDIDDNGTLDKDEFDEGLREILGLRLNKLEIDLVFEVCDRDGDYTVEKYELDSMLHVTPKEMEVTFKQFRKSLVSLGYNLEPENCYRLWKKLDLKKGMSEKQLMDTLENSMNKTMTSTELAEQGKQPQGEDDSNRMALIRFDDLHLRLEPVRKEIVKFYLLEEFEENVREAILDAEECSQGRWNILDVPAKIFHTIHSFELPNQLEIFRRLRAYYENDMITYEEEQNLAARPATPSTLADGKQLLLDILNNVGIEAKDSYFTKLPNSPTNLRKILSSTERAATNFAVSYVKAMMQSKLIRVRDIFREMDQDGSGAVDEDEFIEGMMKIGMKDIRPNEIRLLYQAIDKDGDKSLTLLEMDKALRGVADYGTVNRDEFISAMEMLGIHHLMETVAESDKSKEVRESLSRRKLSQLFDDLSEGKGHKRRILFEAVVIAVRQLRRFALTNGQDDGSGMDGLAHKAAVARARAEERALKFRQREQKMRASDGYQKKVKTDSHMFGTADRGLQNKIKKSDNRDWHDHEADWDQIGHVHNGGVKGFGGHAGHVGIIASPPNNPYNKKGSPLAANRKTYNQLSKEARAIISRFGDDKVSQQLTKLFRDYNDQAEKIGKADWDALAVMTDKQKWSCLNRFYLRLKRAKTKPTSSGKIKSMLFMPEKKHTGIPRIDNAGGFNLDESANLHDIFDNDTLDTSIDDTNSFGDTSLSQSAPAGSLKNLDKSFRVSPPKNKNKKTTSSSWSPEKVRSTKFKEFNGIATWRLPPTVTPKEQRGIAAKPQNLNGVSALVPQQVKDQLRQSGIIQHKSMDGALQKCKTLVGTTKGLPGGEKAYAALVLPGSDADMRRLRLQRNNKTSHARNKSTMNEF